MSLERRLAAAFLAAHPVDAASAVERLGPGEAAAVLAESSPGVAAGVLRHVAPSAAVECLGQMATPAAAAVVAELPLDAAALLLRRLPDAAAQELLGTLPPAVGGPLGAILRYPEYTAGAVMDPRVLAVPEDLTVDAALAGVRRTPRHVLYYVYVVDRSGGLVGVLNLRELMLAPADATLATVMRPASARLSVLDGLRAVVVHPGWRTLHAMPVVDAEGRFAGAVRYETVRRLGEDLDRTTPAGTGLGTLLGLAELCWVGMTGVMVGLGSGGGVRAATPPEQGGGS